MSESFEVRSRGRRCILFVLVTFAMTTPLIAREAKSQFVKATIDRVPWTLHPNATAPPGFVLPKVLDGLNGQVLEEYDGITLVEVHDNDKDKIVERGRRHSVRASVHDDFDKIFLNGHVLDARFPESTVPPGHAEDPPYPNDERGTWVIQFIGPIKAGWLDTVRAAGVVPVQHVPMNAYIIGARESAIRTIAALPFVQWTSQMHRFLKPSIGPRSEETVELWIEVARTEETDLAIQALENLAVGPIAWAPWSDSEVRVQGVFRTADLETIRAEPLVFMLDERPLIALSDERTALAVTDLVPAAGSNVAGKYKKWLNDTCPSCESTSLQTSGMDLRGDGFYIGIADTGLDGGDRVASGTLPGETGSSDLHRPELAKSRVVWGKSFEKQAFDAGRTWTDCTSFTMCPDTTQSKHDTIGHGTLVTAIAAGDPLPTGPKDTDGFLWGMGVAPSAGIVVTKINTLLLGSQPSATPVRDVTRNARSETATSAYWQNFSMNQYRTAPVAGSQHECERFFDGRYSLLSRDFDVAVVDADDVTAGEQPITLTVSSGNVNQQSAHGHCLWIDRTLTLPPATAKNVIAMGGGEAVRPDSWNCANARADDFANLAYQAKRGTATPGWFKPDLIAVSSNIAAVKSNDQVTGTFCASADASVPLPYSGGTGTSFSAPVGVASAALASRRFSSNPAAAKPSLVKAMLIAGAKSMRGGRDRGSLTRWFPAVAYSVGSRVIPTVPNGRYYEVEVSQTFNATADPTEPAWPVDGGTIQHQAGHTVRLTWRDKGLEPGIAAFPNNQQGFGRINLTDVLSDYPSRVFMNDHMLEAGSTWTASYTIHDPLLPVRIALVWSDAPGVAQSGWGQTPSPAPAAPLVNNLNLSVLLNQGGPCTGRYTGNLLTTDEQSILYTDCVGGTPDSKNNVEVARFFASAGTAFEVRVDSAAQDQRFSLVVWNAYAGVEAPPARPASLTATATSTSQVSLSWASSAGAASYEVQRSAGVHAAFVTIAEPATPSSIDSEVTAGTTYLYRVRARNGTQVSDWVIDPATTVIFSDLAAIGSVIRASHVNELRQAVLAMRSAGGVPPLSWTDGPAVVSDVTQMKAVHVTELRSALNEARLSLGLAAGVFTDLNLIPGETLVKAVHITDLRGGVE